MFLWEYPPLQARKPARQIPGTTEPMECGYFSVTFMLVVEDAVPVMLEVGAVPVVVVPVHAGEVAVVVGAVEADVAVDVYDDDVIVEGQVW
mmetsp:Transcript_27380/g.57639  ORF Transcript_27380/g.57639 Transcript_27380/m.57639 type:complete len:91 (-) Transcript_27380:1151-1423(-)